MACRLFFRLTDYAGVKVDNCTSAARFKKQVWYQTTLGYGDYVLDEPVDSVEGWTRGPTREFRSPFLALSPWRRERNR